MYWIEGRAVEFGFTEAKSCLLESGDGKSILNRYDGLGVSWRALM